MSHTSVAGRPVGVTSVDNPFDDKRTGLEPIAQRVPIERKIDLRFPTFEGMVSGVSANLSTSGMFIQSTHPEQAGTEFAFALRIDEWSPIQGTAKVVWIRPNTESPERPAGMGVQFLDLDAQSRRMIRWLVDKHLQEGGTLFDLDTVPAGASRYGGKNAKRPRRSANRVRRAASGSRFGNRWLLLILCLLVAGGAALAAYLQWFDRQPGIGPLRRPDPIAAGSSRPGTPVEAAGEATDDVEETPPVSIEAVAGFIRSWSDAWEARDADSVLAHYAADFDASAYGGRNAWAARVRQEIEGSDHIRIAISGLEVTFDESDGARALFFRSYRSSSDDDSGRMALDLVPSADGWRIRRELDLD